jgi:hypothetical protein
MNGAFIQTFSGAKIYPLNPDPADIRLVDIAHALSNLCRYTGHSQQFYSVAQHSVHVSEIVPWDCRLLGLLHDAPEAFLQDIPSPLKRSPEFAFYREAEARMERAIWEAFGLTPPTDEQAAAIKQADLELLATEATQLLAPLHRDWELPCKPLPMMLEPWCPSIAKRTFLDTFHDLNYRHQLRRGTWG